MRYIVNAWTDLSDDILYGPHNNGGFSDDLYEFFHHYKSNNQYIHRYVIDIPVLFSDIIAIDGLYGLSQVE